MILRASSKHEGRPVAMLYAGLDLSRKRVDFHLLDGEGATLEVGAAPRGSRPPSPRSRHEAGGPGGKRLPIRRLCNALDRLGIWNALGTIRFSSSPGARTYSRGFGAGSSGGSGGGGLTIRSSRSTSARSRLFSASN